MAGVDYGTPPDLRDSLVGRIVFDGSGEWPHYRHPGAMQIVGDVLAVPLSKPGSSDMPMRIQFIDIADPAVPRPLSSFIVTGGHSDFGAGAARISVCIGPPHRDYYAAPIAVSWDLNDDKTYETHGTSASFSAAAFDGPTVALVPTRAQHATDTTALGTGTTPFPVTVRNVAPVIRKATVTDPLGRDLAGGANLTIAGVPVRLAATFTDPGRADTQSASVHGAMEPSTRRFKTFSDARNGATGQLGDTYVYASPGTYEIVASIKDDDERRPSPSPTRAAARCGRSTPSPGSSSRARAGRRREVRRGVREIRQATQKALTLMP